MHPLHGFVWRTSRGARSGLKRETRRSRRRAERTLAHQILHSKRDLDNLVIIEKNHEAEDQWRHD